jgi:surface polysaccharide O-acyltransferase-like enzyme
MKEGTFDNKRNLGIDLLRIVSMFFIIILHILGQGGLLQASNRLTFKYEMLWLIEIIANCSVNCYALISGYVGYDSKFNISRYLNHWSIVVFYSIGFTIVFNFVLPGSVGLIDIFKSMFPVTFQQYWYFTSYTIVYFFAPCINKIVREFEKNTVFKYLVIALLSFSVIPTMFCKNVFGEAYGYSALWLCTLFMIGAYLKKYEITKKIEMKIAMLGFMGSVLFTWMIKFLIENLSNTFLGNPKGGRILVEYNSPTILMAAICLVTLFQRFKINNYLKKIIYLISPLSFSVYLIHTHPQIWKFVFENRFKYVIEYSPLKIVACILTIAGIVFCVCIAIDCLRKVIFELLGVEKYIIIVGNFAIKSISYILNFLDN